MTPMTIEQLYEKLKDKDFQDTSTNLFYNYYVFQYDPQQEAEIYSQLKQYQENQNLSSSTFVFTPAADDEVIDLR